MAARPRRNAHAHTNAPGSRHEKRWQDVEEILGAGISVMTAMNVQHLEGVHVREAATVILVDLPVPELQERLKQGKIYPPEQAKRALDDFFRADLLVNLRELALLQTADYSGRHAARKTRPRPCRSSRRRRVR